MAGWDGEHGIVGHVNEQICGLVMGRRKNLPALSEISIGEPTRVGNGFVLVEQGDFHYYEECNPCIAARLVYVDENGEEWPAAEVFAPFKDPDTGKDLGWDFVVEEAYTEMSEAVEYRMY